MIAFTILGVLVFWYAMGLVGYFLGMYLDVRRGLHQLTAPVESAYQEVEVLIHFLTAGGRANG